VLEQFPTHSAGGVRQVSTATCFLKVSKAPHAPKVQPATIYPRTHARLGDHSLKLLALVDAFFSLGKREMFSKHTLQAATPPRERKVTEIQQGTAQSMDSSASVPDATRILVGGSRNSATNRSSHPCNGN